MMTCTCCQFQFTFFSPANLQRLGCVLLSTSFSHGENTKPSLMHTAQCQNFEAPFPFHTMPAKPFHPKSLRKKKCSKLGCTKLQPKSIVLELSWVKVIDHLTLDLNLKPYEKQPLAHKCVRSLNELIKLHPYALLLYYMINRQWI